MLRELNENEMEMVSGGNHEEGHDEVISTGTRTTNPGVSMDYLNSIGMTIGEYLYGPDYNISSELLASLGSLVLPEGVSVGTVTLPDPDPTIDPQNPTDLQTIDLTGLTVDIGGGANITVGANSSGTVGFNVTQNF